MSTPPAASTSAPDGFARAARSEQLARDDARLQVEISGRHLILLRRAGRVFAMDATCYHMGAPLLHGDVEDVPGHGACITCPWHHYQISLGTGERLYQDMQRQICTLPKKQRVHETREADGVVYVRLSGGGKPPSPPPGAPKPKPHELPKPDWESDRYAFKPPPPSRGRDPGPRAPFARSGSVFAAGARARGTGFPGAGIGVGEMVARSMKGGDGKAPWAMAPNAGLAAGWGAVAAGAGRSSAAAGTGRGTPPPPPPPAGALPAVPTEPPAVAEDGSEGSEGEDEYDYAKLKDVPP